MKHKYITIFIVLILLVLSFIPLKYLGSEFIPSYDNDIINISIQTPEGTSLEKTLKVVRELENHIKKYPEVKNYLSYTGIDGYENAKISINLIPSEHRVKSDLDIMDELLEKSSFIPSATITFSREAEGGENADIVIDVYGNNYEKLIKLSKKMSNSMRDTGFFRTIDLSYKTPKKEIVFIPDQDKLIYYGLDNISIASIIRTSVNGNDDNIYKEEGEEYKINIELNDFYKQNIDDISKIGIITKDGLLSISKLGKLVYQDATPSIYRRDKQRVIQIFGHLSKSNTGTVQKIIDNKFKKINFPNGFKYKYSGNDEMFKESVSEIAKAFIIAVVLTYMLLVAILNSFSIPFVIASSIITSFISALIFKFFLEHTINIASMMAMIMLVGLVVNNAILLIDYALQKIKEGAVLREAIWLGAKEKNRTILMTSFAIIFGTLPQLFDKMIAKASIASVIIGGMIGSIIFTYILIPVVFEIVYKLFYKQNVK